MAWNKPGDNNNDDNNNDENQSNKPNNPWGSGGNQPPDLEKVVGDFFNKFKSALGGSDNGSGSKSGQPESGSALPIIFLLLAVTAYVIWSSAHQIEEAERGVVLTFGKYDKTMESGLNFTWPSPIAKVYKVDVRQLYSVGESGEMLTEDKNLVFLDFDIQYRIREDKVQDYLFVLESPDSAVKHSAESAVRQVVGTNTMRHLLNENRQIAINNIVEELQAMLDQYSSGIQVTNFNFREVHPPAQVKGAFDDVVKAREDAKTYVNEAKKYAREKVPLAEGSALQIIQQAQAYKQATITKAEGEAQQFDLVRAQYELAPEVTKERLYLETMEQVMRNTSKVIIDSKNSNNMMYLPLDQMMKNSRKTKPDTVYLGTSTVTAPRVQNNSSSQNSNKNATKRVGRGGQ
ncbi:MAG: FtsH protease activity modulator HflK [Proteobacteria bacterium]|nr:FtsH protease activity modulator HflK [Pseudomonadota bacterium]